MTPDSLLADMAVSSQRIDAGLSLNRCVTVSLDDLLEVGSRDHARQ